MLVSNFDNFKFKAANMNHITFQSPKIEYDPIQIKSNSLVGSNQGDHLI